MGKCKDLSDFYEGQIVKARQLGEHFQISSGMFPVCSGYYLPKVVQGRSTSKLVTESWVVKAYGCAWVVKASPSGLIPQKRN